VITRRLLTSLLTTALIAALIAQAPAGPANAAVSIEARLATLASWTQTTVDSYRRWDAARRDQDAWAAYGFDWSTDYCSASPDTPLGFDFTLPCWRHDFGYRNYKRAGLFEVNKSRVDDGFYADLLRVCSGYSLALRTLCDSLALLYYQAVRVFGDTVVTQAQLDRAARSR
jgi:hypothetical protein